MKKHIFLLFALSAIWGVRAQESFLFTDFEPNLNITNQDDTLYMDFDQNGTNDAYLTIEAASPGYWFYIKTVADWELSAISNVSLPINNVEEWGCSFCWLDEPQSKFAIRHKENNRFLYGWFAAFQYITFEPFTPHLELDKMVFCLIPDYPLLWGQTSLNWNFSDESTDIYVSVHPNLTDGTITIVGNGLRSAVVYNMLGQYVISAQGDGDQITVDLGGQPAGIYFVNVTDTEGRKCVRKVVKR